MHDHPEQRNRGAPETPGRGATARHAAHDQHAGHSSEVFSDRFWLALVLSIPVVATSPMIMDWFGYQLGFPGVQWIPPALGTIIYGYGGWPFLVGAVAEARARQPGMMLLIGMAITVGFLASWSATLDLFAVEVWWELSLLVVVMLLGHWLEMRAVGQARRALAALAELLPDEAERVTESGQVQTVRVSDLAVGEDTALAGIQRMVAAAQQSTSRSQVLADRAAALLFYVAVGVAAVTVSVWALLGQPDAALTRSVTVLIIACPHALGLAIPLVTAIATSKSARRGILVKDRLALERMRNVDAVLFDKTGTLTRGEHVVTGVASLDGVDEDELLALAAAAEADSEHPLARAIVAAAQQRGVDAPLSSEFRSMTGRGVQARLNGATVAVGGPALVRDIGAATPAGVSETVAGWQQRGAAVLQVLRDGSVIGALALEDQVRPESRPAVVELHRQEVLVAMITGDARQVAEAVAADLGIDEVFAEVLPEDKDAGVANLQRRGHTVADVAMESAGIVLASDDPRGVVTVRKLSRSSYRKMLQNLWWAAGYNVVALMSLSTVIVAINAQLLRRVDLRPEAVAG